MKQILLAKRYAKALFDLAIEEKVIEKINVDMELVAVVMKENRELRRLMINPVISPGRKKSIIKSIFGTHIDKRSLAFLDILVRKGREMEIGEIAVQFNILFLDYKNIAIANLVTATAINDDLGKRIASLLSSHTSKEIKVEKTIEPEIIGGFKLNMDDYLYDASISKIIRKLHKEFDKNLFIKGF
ncbi:MAG: ATP synthase F1 subunit delta [Bacteroidetes bacterium HGW-Bacteroidetes-1]|jgi:F-type H+-transporting ATPase subunit delta|nr:MAG: ATP synthase F1 subunit delta [Bacteroidetes bacterium HGW-Bacteroidetes-1]